MFHIRWGRIDYGTYRRGTDRLGTDRLRAGSTWGRTVLGPDRPDTRGDTQKVFENSVH